MGRTRICLIAGVDSGSNAPIAQVHYNSSFPNWHFYASREFLLRFAWRCAKQEARSSGSATPFPFILTEQHSSSMSVAMAMAVAIAVAAVELLQYVNRFAVGHEHQLQLQLQLKLAAVYEISYFGFLRTGWIWSLFVSTSSSLFLLLIRAKCTWLIKAWRYSTCSSSSRSLPLALSLSL